MPVKKSSTVYIIILHNTDFVCEILLIEQEYLVALGMNESTLTSCMNYMLTRCQ